MTFFLFSEQLVEDSGLQVIGKRIEFYGGALSKLLDFNVTHIIVESNRKYRPRLKEIREHVRLYVKFDVFLLKFVLCILQAY